jgi:hypothetical protein
MVSSKKKSHVADNQEPAQSGIQMVPAWTDECENLESEGEWEALFTRLHEAMLKDSGWRILSHRWQIAIARGFVSRQWLSEAESILNDFAAAKLNAEDQMAYHLARSALERRRHDWVVAMAECESALALAASVKNRHLYWEAYFSKAFIFADGTCQRFWTRDAKI